MSLLLPSKQNSRVSLACMMLIGCSVLALFTVPVSAQETKSVELDVTAVLTEVGGPFQLATSNVEVGDVSKGTKHTLKLSIHNGTDRDLEFASVQTSCACSSAEIPAGKVGRGETIESEVKFNTPHKIRNGVFSIRLKLMPGNGRRETAVIDLNCSVRGTLQYDKTQSIFAVTSEISNWKVPFSFTAPVDPQNIEITCSQNLRDVVFKLFTKDGFHFVDAMIPREVAENGNVAGWVKIKDSVVNTEDTLEFVLMKTPPIKISPTQLMFRRRGEEYVARAMIQVHSDFTEKAAKNEEKVNAGVGESAITAKCVVNEAEASVKVSKLSERIARAEVVISKEALAKNSDGGSAVQWTVFQNGKSYNQKSVFQILD